MKFRNKLVEYLTDWIMGNSHQLNVQGDMCLVSRDLDQASMEAVASLLAGLPLQVFIIDFTFASLINKRQDGYETTSVR